METRRIIGGSDPRALRRQVYFIKAEGLDILKIGVANCAHARMSTLEKSSPVPLELLGIIWTDKLGTLEKELHQRFAHHRLRWEWFKADPEILAYAAEHSTLPYKRKIIRLK